MRLRSSRSIIDQHEEDGNAAAAEAVRGLFDLDTIDIDVLRGGDGNDTLLASMAKTNGLSAAGTMTVFAMIGDNLITVGSGNDTIFGRLMVTMMSSLSIPLVLTF